MTLIYWERKKRIPQARHKLTRSAKRARRRCLSGEQPGAQARGAVDATQTRTHVHTAFSRPPKHHRSGPEAPPKTQPLRPKTPRAKPWGSKLRRQLLQTLSRGRCSDPARKASLALPPVQILAFNLRGIQRPRQHGNSGHFLSSDPRWSDRGTAAAN